MSVVHVITNLDSALPRRAAYRERRRLRVSTLARRIGLDLRREAVICQRNGRWVYRREWHRVIAGGRDVIIFVVLPQKGEAARSVAALAVAIMAAVIAPQIAGPIALAMNLGQIGTAVLTAATATALAIGGNILVNALIPPARPNLPGLSTSLSRTDAEAPTYAFSVSSRQNLPRLGAPIPELFGYHRIIPDLAATAWWEWPSGRQRLYQTLVLTKGEIEIEKIELGHTPIDTFEEIITEVVPPGGTVTLFEPEVFQSPDVRGIVLTAPNDLLPDDNGERGPFAAVPPGQSTDRIGIDIGFPRGLYKSEPDGSISFKSVAWTVEARPIDDAGAPAGPWMTVAEEVFDAALGDGNVSQTGTFMGGGYATADKATGPLTVSYRYSMPTAARWQIKVARTDNKDLSVRAGHELQWGGLRSFLGGGQYGDVTVLAIAVTATASVNDQTVRQVAVTGTRKLPLWDAETESWTAPTPTRSIFAAAAHVLRDANGAGLSDARFDLTQLIELDAIWTERGDCFDYYASAARTCGEMLQTVLRAGRAVWYRQAGMVRFFRDGPQSLPRQGFSRENIVQGTLRRHYRMPSPESQIDGIEIRYFDRRVWNFATRAKAFAGDDPPLNPQSETLDGVIEVAQVDRELAYRIADFTLRPITATFETELEGVIPSHGDLILICHDAPRWGLSNRVVSYDAASRTVTLWSPPLWSEGTGTWFARLRDRRGRPSAPVAIAKRPGATSVVLAADPTYDDGTPFDFMPSPAETLHIIFGLADDSPREALFRRAVPTGRGSRIACEVVLDHPDVHVN